MKLYEIMCLELIEIGENDISLTIVNEVNIIFLTKKSIRASKLYSEFPERCLKLEHLSKRKSV